MDERRSSKSDAPIRRFKESPRLAVFTTRYVVEGAPITYVTHDMDDGAWQFLSDDHLEDFEEVARIVALEEIIAMDASVLDLADMPVGYSASRRSPSEAWVIQYDIGND